MKNILRVIPLILLGFLLVANTGLARQVDFKSGVPTVKATAAGCAPGANFKWLEINNVRTRINTGGDMWWDFETAQYEIPKGSKKMSMFAAALWIGGMDANGQLKLAAHRYRSGPNNQAGSFADFFSGPLSTDGKASVGTEDCAKYDKLFYITRPEVNNFIAWFSDKAGNPDYQIPQSILTYPAHGDVAKQQSYYLAPFYDMDPDGNGPAQPNGIYDPANDGDYPYYDISNVLCGSKVPTAEGNGILVDQVLKGDATLWWVFNDKGNIHTETRGEPIGLEIRAQAFGFSTNDEINNMTFYSYEIINRSTYRLTQTYFSQWVDADLGFSEDDYVGCDVMRGLGYCYNGTAIDGNGQSFAYGNQPPAVGVDFFQGPYIDADKSSKTNGDNPAITTDGTWFMKGSFDLKFTGAAQLVLWDGDTIGKAVAPGDTMYTVINSAALNGINFGNGVEDDERFGMRRFVYHERTGSNNNITDPSVAADYYNFLRGRWKNGDRMRYGGNGENTAYGDSCEFMFPGTTDIYNWGTQGKVQLKKDWSERTENNPVGDRRFMESAGPFILEPGAVNYITVGIPWAQAQSGGPDASITLLKQVDDKCQQLFDNCFKVISGPNAPDLTIREMDKELILYLTNRKTNDAGNNFQEKYVEYDPRIQAPEGQKFDTLYHFEGYQIYQLKDATVSVADLKKPELARLVFQCDVKNDVGKMVNFYYNQNLGGSVPVEEVGNLDGFPLNNGIIHSVKMKRDAFSGNALVNHKQYYYLAIAYAQNNFKPYVQVDPTTIDGQKLPYLAGRSNIKTYTAIPHLPVGLVSSNSEYGDGVIITRNAGQGNGGQFLELADESVAEILSKPMADAVTNLPGSATYPIAYNLKYKKSHGPINVRVIDPLNISEGSYSVKFDSMYNVRVPLQNVDTLILASKWSLWDNKTNKVYVSDTTIDVLNEQLFLDLGFSVSIEQQYLPGPYVVDKAWVPTSGGVPGHYTPVYGVYAKNNGLIGATMSYQDSSRKWLNFLPDIDGVGQLDWIKAGVNSTDWQNVTKLYDPEGIYETVLDGTCYGQAGRITFAKPKTGGFATFTNGTWTPYIFAQSANVGGDSIFGIANRESPSISQTYNVMIDNASIDIVFTKDRTKWTRSAVVEESSNTNFAEGKAKRHDLRKHRSVNQDGDTLVSSTDPAKNSEFIAPYGMGWFPGYAINVETGERLNIVFGEDSRLNEDGGKDLKFNPSNRVSIPGKPMTKDNIVMGGRHYIYVLAHVVNKKSYPGMIQTNPATPADTYDNPAYDGCAHFVKLMNANYATTFLRSFMKGFQFSNCMWTAIPFGPADSDVPWLDNDVKIQLRIMKPYARYFGTPLTGGAQNTNKYWPMYTFDTKSVATDTNNVTKAETDLDQINVVPNPYYAYSRYETNQLDNRVKIVNLPQKCTITIYSTNGNIIRQYNKDETKTSIDWDLKNFAGIPISGGVYIIHVKSDQGEKIIKWFGSLRPVDLNAF